MPLAGVFIAYIAIKLILKTIVSTKYYPTNGGVAVDFDDALRPAGV